MQRFLVLPASFALLFVCSAGVEAAMTATPAPQQRSALSLDCSKQADAKGLHGQARKHFRSGCMRAAKKPA